jgi:hypothetical protein
MDQSPFGLIREEILNKLFGSAKATSSLKKSGLPTKALFFSMGILNEKQLSDRL